MHGEKRIFVLAHDSTLVFLHTRSKQMASLAHIGAGALRTGDAIHDIPLSLRGKGVLHVHQCFAERFRWLVDDVEVVGSKVSGYRF